MRILNKLSIIGVLLSAMFYIGACGSSSSTTSTTSAAPTGSGSVTLDPTTNVLTGSFITMNVTSAIAAHIHDGDVGLIGPPVVTLTQSTAGTWSVPTTPPVTLNATQIARLKAGGYYVNVHTTLNKDGEIRGQLIQDSANVNKFNATLDLAHEVPPPTTPTVTTTTSIY